LSAPPLSPLEFRLERNKRLSNLRFDLLKRLGYGRSVIERYCGGEFDLHIHFRTDEGMVCAAYRFGDCRETGVGFVGGPEDDDGVVPLDAFEFPVFVAVGNLSEGAAPFASCVRLQSLDCCDMCGIDALEVTRLNPTVEALFVICKRKLRIALLNAGIELGELEDEIVESASEVVGDLANQHADRQRRTNALAHIRDEIVRGLRVELRDNGILLFYEPIGEVVTQISKCFLCPRYPYDRAVEYVRGHDTMP